MCGTGHESVGDEHKCAELRRLTAALRDAVRRLDHRRCLLILTYLLHARHLIDPEVLKPNACGELMVKMADSSNKQVATCAKTLLKLWRFGLTDGMRVLARRELEKRMKSVRKK